MSLKLILGRAILVYQMPKCGSQTVEATLRASGLPHHILRFHSLSATQAAELRRCIRSDATDPTWRSNAMDRLRGMSRISRALRLRRFLVACGVGLPRLEVITAVRDVIGAGLSTVFENHQLHAPAPELLTPEKCREKLAHPRVCGYFQAWFDEELNPHLGIDVYAAPFPTEARYCVYETPFARVLLYRFDLLSQVASLLSRFLGMPIQPLVPRNLSASKDYAEAYDSVKKRLRLPGAFLVEQLNSRMMRHFYSPQERNQLRQRWAGYFLQDLDHVLEKCGKENREELSTRRVGHSASLT